MSGRVKPSRLLKRLDAEISGAKSALEANCKRAERIAYLARLGQLAQARSELGVLRSAYASRPNAEMSSWLNLSEGLIDYFSSMDTDSREKILRSHALSTASDLPRIGALSAAWLAHMDYLRADATSMTRHASEALRLSDETDHAVRARVSLAVAQAYHFAGRLDIGLVWYGQARAHAVADGDDATLSALMYNMAWLRSKHLRASDCKLAPPPTDQESHALLAAESTANFDALIGATSLPALVPMLRAQILTVRGDYAEALRIFEADALPAARQGMRKLQAGLLADQAWCRVRLDQMQLALKDADEAEATIDPSSPFDDRALTHGRLAQTFTVLGDSTGKGRGERAERHRALAEQAWSGHVGVQVQMLQALARLSPPQAPPHMSSR